MAPILGADHHRAGEAAIHLGVAMQMTNIARDVLEDARNGRRYVPGCWVEQRTAHEIVGSIASRQQVSAAIARLLALADHYYASAAQGFPLIPAPARRAIQIAAAIYREIGTALCLGWSDLARLAIQPRILQLSRPLTGLPGAP
jgi:phytoene synthase